MEDKKIKLIFKILGNENICLYFNEDDYDNYYFNIIDIIKLIADSKSPDEYWNNLKNENKELLKDIIKISTNSKSEIIETIKFSDIIKLIIIINNKKTNKFKNWILNLIYDRLEEIFKPEMAIDRAINYYRISGRSYDWINERIKFIYDRNRLFNTREYESNNDYEYKILYNEIYKNHSLF